jgi:predicted metalloprotease with PDZ domain
MKNKLFLLAALLLTSCATPGDHSGEKLSFVVSVEDPSTKLCHVEFDAEGLKGATHDFIMPAWTPGYYKILDYERYVTNFAAVDGTGHALVWKKADKNTWRVQTGGASAVKVTYNVVPGSAIFQSALNDSSFYLAPPDTFMYLDGQIKHPVVVTIKPKVDWTKIATGLDPVPGQSNTFYAPDFDILYDCPMLMGKLDVLPFEVSGVHHEFDGPNLGNFDRVKFVSELKRMVESATTLMGDIPYEHYTFIVAGRGGGIEHLDETTLPFNAASITNAAGNKRWLSFVAHEYFHNFNVKRIRPLVLGPFDYERENRTYMLWVSEGFTVYYEYMILRRAGLLNEEDVLNGDGTFRGFSATMAAYENSLGHLYQSAAESSWKEWDQPSFGGSSRVGPNLTITYYDKGPIVGAMLDLKIRHETEDRKSLDDVMRGLYHEYYLEKKRGFTDAEFKEMCERVAGANLDEVFDYAYTTKPVDYPKYFAYAGLDVAMPKAVAGTDFGAAVMDVGGKLTLAGVEPVSGAERAGLLVHDVIVSAEGKAVNTNSFQQLLDRKKAGDKLEVEFARDGKVTRAQVVLEPKIGPGKFTLTRQANPSPLQAAILKDWLRGP